MKSNISWRWEVCHLKSRKGKYAVSKQNIDYIILDLITLVMILMVLWTFAVISSINFYHFLICFNYYNLHHWVVTWSKLTKYGYQGNIFFFFNIFIYPYKIVFCTHFLRIWSLRVYIFGEFIMIIIVDGFNPENYHSRKRW